MPNQLLNKKMTENVFQISLIAAIYFLLFAHPIVFNLVDKVFEMVGVQMGDTMLTIVHSVVFALFFFYTVRYVSSL
tara:strand:+ start:899 stop:1126 length:228 start_codon:yes stop_codon:yes gene_type:complete